MTRYTTRAVASVSWLVLASIGLSVLVAAPASADPVASKRAEAAKVTRQLETLAQRASVLTEDYNEARVRAAELETRARNAVAELARIESKAAAARSAMKQISVRSYVRGGLAPASPRTVSEMSDLGRAQFYVRAAANRQKDAIDELRSAQAALAEKQASLTAAKTRAKKVLEQVAAKRKAASGAEVAQRKLLASVNGDLARLVAAEQRRRTASAAAVRPAPAPRADRAAKPVAAPPGTDAPAANSAAAAAVAEAKRQLGKPYKWAGSGPDNFDCSGLTSWAWRVGGGRSLPHSSRAQYSATSRVPVSEIAPGDLLFYGSSVSTIHHVGIYSGGGYMVDAPESGRNVQYVPAFRRDLIGVGRVN
ncbi:MAG TPA: NlpC/P60 family protein [Acidimicrobiales bacterium]|nr:NlpC/P60 family protein [Acidimicrobiales bacterium]